MGADAVFHNRDYEPYARRRDCALSEGLQRVGKVALTFADHVIHEPGDIAAQAGTPYSVYTSY